MSPLRTPHTAALEDLERIADETIALAEQIKVTVAALRAGPHNDDDHDGGDHDPAGT